MWVQWVQLAIEAFTVCMYLAGFVWILLLSHRLSGRARITGYWLCGLSAIICCSLITLFVLNLGYTVRFVQIVPTGNDFGSFLGILIGGGSFAFATRDRRR